MHFRKLVCVWEGWLDRVWYIEDMTYWHTILESSILLYNKGRRPLTSFHPVANALSLLLLSSSESELKPYFVWDFLKLWFGNPTFGKVTITQNL